MSLDGAFLHCVKDELSALIGARVDKIYQPSREEIIMSLRMLGGEDRSAKKIVFSAGGTAARVHLTEQEYENPSAPPLFCMILRKHLSGGKLVNIRQDGLERVLFFDFECVNEIGDKVTNTLTSEIMGRYSNIILIRDGRVVDSIKRITDGGDESFTGRRILPNISYEPPSRAERLCLLDVEIGEVLNALFDGEYDGQRLAKALSAVLEGIAPIFARECAFYAAGDVDAAVGELSEPEKMRVGDFFENAKNALDGAASYTLLTDETGNKKDFSFVDVKQYGALYKAARFDSPSKLLDEFFGAAAKQDRMKQKARDLLKTVNTAYERVSRKLELQKKELAECGEREVFRVTGDLVNANIYRLEKGMTKCVLEDFYTGEPREITLDARLTPAQNAQKYYNEYRKLDTAEKKLTELIKKGGEELSYLDSVLDSVQRAENDSELSEIRRELREQGYLRAQKGDDRPSKKLSEPLKFRSTEGCEILVGRNNRQNDLLTLKTAKATDIWLHTKDIAGSHVIIRTNGQTPSEQTIVEAAMLAAFHSKGKSGSGVPVDYVAVKFVKKPAGAKP
ncbi:MAG: NFACT family protein [Oscillospiraceae bacterium]|nr:NFACT family protein [Oscillospiraceae bacterium]